MEKNGQWRFTPPTHVLAALDRALDQHAAEGGVAGRGARYRRNCAQLVEGLRAMGFETLLPDRLQAPIIVTVRMPADPKFHFETFYDRLARRGFVIYPGKLTVADSFRIGCIGALGEPEMRGALEAIRDVIAELGVASCAPAGRPGASGRVSRSRRRAGSSVRRSRGRAERIQEKKLPVDRPHRPGRDRATRSHRRAERIPGRTFLLTRHSGEH